MGEPAFKITAFLERNRVTVSLPIMCSTAIYPTGSCGRWPGSHRSWRFTPLTKPFKLNRFTRGLGGVRPDHPADGRCHTGIPVSVGVAPTKVLAKVANHRAKKTPAQKGVCVLDHPRKIAEALKDLDVGEVWGIGRQYTKLLNSIQVYTAWDFLQLDDDWVRKKMTVVGLRIKKELAGTACLEMELIPPAKKVICTSRSFGEEQTELAPINEAVATTQPVVGRSSASNTPVPEC